MSADKDLLVSKVISDRNDPKVIEIFNLMSEVLNLAKVACHFDRNHNYVGACDYYDNCILTIDEVLNNINPESENWKLLMEMRTKYEDRMEYLRELETSKFNFPFSNKSEEHIGTSSSRKKNIIFSDETNFSSIQDREEFINSYPLFEFEGPYWILSNIKNTIESGGFLTKEIFVPKKVWLQSDIKLNGITAKITAFDMISKLITDSMEPLFFCNDEISINEAERSTSLVLDELITIQNHLSKPFPYIKEHIKERENSVNKKYQSKNQSGKILTSFVKNVRKYAEVGYQRLLVAIPSKISDEEMKEYVNIIIALCAKVQILRDWCLYITLLKNKKNIFLNNDGIQDDENEKYIENEFEDANFLKLEKRYSIDHFKFIDNFSNPEVNDQIDSISISLDKISKIIKSIACEILMRDLEYLIERYLFKMRKSFSKMFWDEDKDSTLEY